MTESGNEMGGTGPRTGFFSRMPGGFGGGTNFASPFAADKPSASAAPASGGLGSFAMAKSGFSFGKPGLFKQASGAAATGSTSTAARLPAGGFSAFGGKAWAKGPTNAASESSVTTTSAQQQQQQPRGFSALLAKRSAPPSDDAADELQTPAKRSVGNEPKMGAKALFKTPPLTPATPHPLPTPPSALAPPAASDTAERLGVGPASDASPAALVTAAAAAAPHSPPIASVDGASERATALTGNKRPAPAPQAAGGGGGSGAATMSAADAEGAIGVRAGQQALTLSRPASPPQDPLSRPVAALMAAAAARPSTATAAAVRPTAAAAANRGTIMSDSSGSAAGTGGGGAARPAGTVVPQDMGGGGSGGGAVAEGTSETEAMEAQMREAFDATRKIARVASGANANALAALGEIHAAALLLVDPAAAAAGAAAAAAAAAATDVAAESASSMALVAQVGADVAAFMRGVAEDVGMIGGGGFGAEVLEAAAAAAPDALPPLAEADEAEGAASKDLLAQALESVSARFEATLSISDNGTDDSSSGGGGSSGDGSGGSRGRDGSLDMRAPDGDAMSITQAS